MKKKPFYYVGLYKRKRSIIMQAVTDKDMLSNQLIEYLGVYDISKEQMKEEKKAFLVNFKRSFPYFYNCTRLIIE